jgi:hypothetical protein
VGQQQRGLEQQRPPDQGQQQAQGLVGAPLSQRAVWQPAGWVPGLGLQQVLGVPPLQGLELGWLLQPRHSLCKRHKQHKRLEDPCLLVVAQLLLQELVLLHLLQQLVLRHLQGLLGVRPAQDQQF